MAQCECSPCKVIFTSLAAFDKHLGRLTEYGYEHKAPEDAGLVIHENGKVSLPGPSAKPSWRQLWRHVTAAGPMPATGCGKGGRSFFSAECTRGRCTRS